MNTLRTSAARVLAAMLVVLSLFPVLNLKPGFAINGAPQLTFPWGSQLNPDNANPNGQLNYGPHDWNGSDTDQHFHPWNSLDLKPADGRIYAARGGTAYLSCSNEMIQIIHGDGYQTTYIHLAPSSIRITNGQTVTRGTWMANFNTDPNYQQHCGFSGSNHVHFSLWYVPQGATLNFSDSQAVDWGGIPPTAVAGPPQIGAWTVDDGVPQQVYGGCMSPLANPGVRYCGLTQGPAASILNDSLNEQVPVSRRPQGGTEDLFMRGTPIHGYHAPTDQLGTPSFWDDLHGLLKGSPTAVWDSGASQLDVFAIGNDDRPYHTAWTASGWGTWGVIDASPGFGYSGLSLTETVTVDRRPSGTPRLDLLMRGPANEVQHAVLDGAAHLQNWESLGSPSSAGVKGTPSGRWNAQGNRFDVFAIGNDDHLHLITWTASGWTSWSGPYLGPAAASAAASSSGAVASINEMVMAIRAPDDSLDVFFRGSTSNDAVHLWMTSTGAFLGWESAGGIVKGAPDAKWDANMTRLDVFVIGNDDLGYQNTYNRPGGGIPPYWSGWHLLQGGGLSG
jgi:hypothetical protein